MIKITVEINEEFGQTGKESMVYECENMPETSVDYIPIFKTIMYFLQFQPATINDLFGGENND
jgi:hypothetical protein